MFDYIKKWCVDNNILNKTIETFWEYFDEYKTEDYEEYITVFQLEKENVKLVFDKIAYEIDIPDFSQELIAVSANIFVGENNVGWFKQQYSIDGKMFDEFFVID